MPIQQKQPQPQQQHQQVTKELEKVIKPESTVSTPLSSGKVHEEFQPDYEDIELSNMRKVLVFF